MKLAILLLIAVAWGLYSTVTGFQSGRTDEWHFIIGLITASGMLGIALHRIAITKLPPQSRLGQMIGRWRVWGSAIGAVFGASLLGFFLGGFAYQFTEGKIASGELGFILVVFLAAAVFSTWSIKKMLDQASAKPNTPPGQDGGRHLQARPPASA